MINELMKRYPVLECCRKEIEGTAQILMESFRNGGKLLTCGNGGSAADSGHIVGELMKGFILKRPLPSAEQEKLCEMFPEEGKKIAAQLQGALPAISLPDQTALLTAFVNDVAADMMYAQLVYGYGCAGDVLLGISTSGNSANVLNAARVAKFKGMKVIALAGEKACKLDELADIVIHVPAGKTHEVQELHLPVYHALCAWCEAESFS
ncbi:MAG: SIS domain-containing protein [Firmicutes bacterium]|nr:SIS domain-containing protein [Bacillota bacterium]